MSFDPKQPIEGENIDTSLPEIEKSLIRELAMRERVYPGWVSAGRLKPLEARKQWVLMKAALEIVQNLSKLGKQEAS